MEEKKETKSETNRNEYGNVKLRSWSEVLNDGLHKQDIVNRVDAMTLVKPFVIKEIDMLTLKRLVRYCRQNAKNDWGTGIKMLLDAAEADAKTMMLYEKIVVLEDKVESLIGKPQEEKKEKKEFKGFGGGN